MILTHEQIDNLKDKNDTSLDERPLSRQECRNLIRTIEAQQQEIDRLKAIITDSVAEIDVLEMSEDTGISDGLYTAMREAIGLDVAVDSSGEVRQRLKADLYDKLVQIAGLIADKDEQAGRIMRMENGLKDAKRALKEADYIAHGGITCLICEEIKAIDALLGGKEDGK